MVSQGTGREGYAEGGSGFYEAVNSTTAADDAYAGTHPELVQYNICKPHGSLTPPEAVPASQQHYAVSTEVKGSEDMSLRDCSHTSYKQRNQRRIFYLSPAEGIEQRHAVIAGEHEYPGG